MGLTVIIGQLSVQPALDMPTGDELDNIWKLCLAPCYVKCGLLGIFYGGVLEQQHNCQGKLLPGDGDGSVAIINQLIQSRVPQMKIKFPIFLSDSLLISISTRILGKHC